MHSITGRLNKDARTHVSEKGTNFFVSIGEQNYNYRTKEKEWTNYEAAIFATDKQVGFYTDVLVKGSVITVSGDGIIIQTDEQYGPKLILQGAKLQWASNDLKSKQSHDAGIEQARQAVSAPNMGQMYNDMDEQIPFVNPYRGMEFVV